jgi:hypothetical protein
MKRESGRASEGSSQSPLTRPRADHAHRLLQSHGYTKTGLGVRADIPALEDATGSRGPIKKLLPALQLTRYNNEDRGSCLSGTGIKGRGDFPDKRNKRISVGTLPAVTVVMQPFRPPAGTFHPRPRPSCHKQIEMCCRYLMM